VIGEQEVHDGPTN